jgi:hypothetical protein
MLQPNNDLSSARETATEYLRADPERRLVVSINGQFALEVPDAASRAQLVELVDRLEAIAGIQRGLDDLDAGRVSTIEEVRARADSDGP